MIRYEFCEKNNCAKISEIDSNFPSRETGKIILVSSLSYAEGKQKQLLNVLGQVSIVQFHIAQLSLNVPQNIKHCK